MKMLLLCVAIWAGAGYFIGSSVAYNKGYTDALTMIKGRLDKMDAEEEEEEVDTMNQENPKWDI